MCHETLLEAKWKNEDIEDPSYMSMVDRPDREAFDRGEMSMEKRPEELYVERERRVEAAIALRVPDRVPVMSLWGFFSAADWIPAWSLPPWLPREEEK